MSARGPFKRHRDRAAQGLDRPTKGLLRPTSALSVIHMAFLSQTGPSEVRKEPSQTNTGPIRPEPSQNRKGLSQADRLFSWENGVH